MDKEDFKKYYQNTFFQLIDLETGWTFVFLCSGDADINLDDRKKAINALYRFYKAGLCQAVFDDDVEEMLSCAFNAPLNTPIGQASPAGFVEAWDSDELMGTEKAQKVAHELNLKDEDRGFFSLSLYKKLSKIFTDAGVGFEKGNVWPEKN